MTNYSEKAKALFRQGYNCSQALLGAFCEEVGLDFEKALMLASPFGGGIARLRGTCGALIAMVMIIGLKNGYTDTSDINIKAQHYAQVQSAVREFNQRTGSTQCRDLLGGDVSDSPIPTPRTEEFYASRPCERIIGTAAEILEERFFPQC